MCTQGENMPSNDLVRTSCLNFEEQLTTGLFLCTLMVLVVVFVMACLISTSVCCLLLTASLAGVAMGYNYSLAEYIDLKETNISVYIKRGVYDDEISEDFDWRRSGGAEPGIALKDSSGLRLGPGVPEGEQPLAAGRRRGDNSIFESEEQNKYEGGLMRLTSTDASGYGRRFEPPQPPYTTATMPSENMVDELLEVANSLPAGSQERLRAIEAAAKHHEARKIELATAKIPEDPSHRVKAIEANAQIHNARRNDPSSTTDKYAKYFGQLVQLPGFPGSGLSARKFMESHDKNLELKPPADRFRDAVFRGDLSGWPTSGPKSTDGNFFEYEIGTSLALTPPTVKPLLVRPVEGRRPQLLWDMPRQESPIKLSKPEIKEYGNGVPRSKILKDALPKRGRMYSDYDESHGLPVRKKRSDNKMNVNILKVEPDAVSLQTKVTNYRNFNQASASNTDLETFINIESVENPTATKQNHSSDTPIVTFLGSYNNSNNGSINSQVNSLKQFNLPGKTKNVTWKPKKRWKKSTSYENKQTKSNWWGISDDVIEEWNKIISYFNKQRFPTWEYSRKSGTSNNIDSNISDDNQSLFINKLVDISTKTVERNQSDTTELNTIR